MASSSPADVHVLLVDDDRVTRTVVAGLLRKCHYQGAPSPPPPLGPIRRCRRRRRSLFPSRDVTRISDRARRRAAPSVAC